MKTSPLITTLLLGFALSLSQPALAFWGSGGGNPSALNLQSGYDLNTVTTVTGVLLTIDSTDERTSVQLEVESSGVSMIVCIGPQRYWAERTIPFTVGDQLSIRGSKAQGEDGRIYILAEKITDLTREATVVLRNDQGRPAWAGQGRGRNRRAEPAAADQAP